MGGFNILISAVNGTYMIPLKADIVFWVCVVVLMFGISFDSDIMIKKIFTKDYKVKNVWCAFLCQNQQPPRKCLSET